MLGGAILPFEEEFLSVPGLTVSLYLGILVPFASFLGGGAMSVLPLDFLSLFPELPPVFPLLELLLFDELVCRVSSPVAGLGAEVVIVTGPVGPLKPEGAVSITSPLDSRCCSSSIS